MKTLILWASLLASVSAFGQTSVQMRAVPTVGELVSRVPVGSEAIQVLGKATVGDIGPARTFRSVTGLPSGGTNVAHVFASGVSNVYWISTDSTDHNQDVRWWGAVPDDGIDDATAFQSAINYCAGEKTVVIPDGIWRLESALTLPYDYQEIAGSGFNANLQVAHTGNGFQHLGVLSGQDRRYSVRFRNFRMTTAAGITSSNAFYVNDCSYFLWQTVDITQGAGDGFNRALYSYGNYDTSGTNLIFGGNWGNTIRDCTWYNKSGPYYVIHGDGGPNLTGGPNDLRILDSYISGGLSGSASNGAAGAVFVQNANAIRIINNDFEQYSTNSVHLGTNVQSAIITGNRFESLGATAASRRCIKLDEYNVVGHVIQGNMMWLQGGLGSITRIAGPGDSKRISSTILDPSFEGPNQVLASTFLIGTNLDGVARDFGPSGNKTIQMDRNLATTNSIGVGVYDGTNNPRVFVILRDSEDGTGTNSRVDISAASSLASLPVYFIGSKTNATITADGSSILGPKKLGNQLTVYGSGLFGNDPSNPYIEGWTTISNLLALRSSTTNKLALWLGTIDGGDNRRVELSVDPVEKSSSLIHTYTTGGGTMKHQVGTKVVFQLTDSLLTINTNLVVQDGASITLGGVARTSWPTGSGGTNSSRVFWGGTEVADPNFVSSATVERVAPASTTNLAFQVADSSITSNKLASATITPDKLTALSSADLRGKLSDETGTGAAVFAGGDIGAATATTASANSSNTLAATTAYVDRAVAASPGGGGGSSNVLWVDGVAVTNANLLISSEIDPSVATVTNVSFALRTGSIATNKIDSTFHGFISGKQDALVNSAGLAGELSDETGTGAAVFAGSPALTGTPTVNGTNFMSLLNSKLITKTVFQGAAQSGIPPSSSYATFSTRNAIGVLEFDHTTQEAARWVFCLPTEYDYSSGVNVVIQWASSATSGNGRWGARIALLTGVDIDSDTFDTAVEATTATSGTAGLVTTTTLSAVGVDSAAAGDLVMLEIYRDVGDAADTINSNDLQLLGIRVNLP